MTAPAARPRRHRGGWFADRPVGVTISSLITFSAMVGVVLAIGVSGAAESTTQALGQTRTAVGRLTY